MPRPSPFGERNPNWRGGRSVSSNGYVLLRVGKNHPLADVRGYVYEHRLKAWESGQDVIGKHVHHDDEDRQHNAIENLEPLTPAEHHFRHRKRDAGLRLPGEPNRVVECACKCGAKFDLYDSNGRPRKYVSGHNKPDAPAVKELLRLIGAGITKTADLIEKSQFTKHTVKSLLSRMGKNGLIQSVKRGQWSLNSDYQ